MNEQSLVREPKAEHGFTLVELIIAIVLVGILSAVAIVGLSGLTSTSNKSQCSTVFSAAQSAATTYYANNNVYPTTFTALTSGTPALLTLPAGVNNSFGTGNNLYAGTAPSTAKWAITMLGGGGIAPNTYQKFGGGTACS